MMTPLTGKLQGRKDEKEGWAPLMADGDMTFDHMITDWEVIFTGVKHSWDMVDKFATCETFFLPA